jgi:hypothetical protein
MKKQRLRKKDRCKECVKMKGKRRKRKRNIKDLERKKDRLREKLKLKG